MKIFRIIWMGVLVIGVVFGSLVQGQVFLEQPADVVIYKDKGKTYAKVTERRLAALLKLEPGNIIAGNDEGGSDADVIQKAIDMVQKTYEGFAGEDWAKVMLAKFLIKKGTYQLGKQGIRIPHGWPCAIEGEDRARTVLQYDGDGIALGFSREEVALTRAHPKCVLEVRKLTIRITGNAEAGIWSIKMETDVFEDISVIAAKEARPKFGLHIVGGEGHLRFVRNVSVVGPFEVGIEAPAGWLNIFDVKVNGFRKYGITICGGCNEVYLANISTSQPGAKAGIACIGGKFTGGVLRSVDRMILFKTPFQREEYFRGGGGLLCMEIMDESPRLEGYTPFMVREASIFLAACRAKSYKQLCMKGGRAHVYVFDKELNWLLPDLRKVARDLSAPDPKIDVVVYKDEQDKTSAQVISRRASKKLGVKTGYCLEGESGTNLIQKVIDGLPRRGKIYFKQGIYETGALKIPCDKEITIEGHGKPLPYRNIATTLKTEGITFEGSKDTGKLPVLCLKNLSLEGGDPSLTLSRARAVVRNVNFRCPKAGKTGILIDGSREVVLANVRFLGLQADGVCIDDRGEGTVIIGPWVWAVKLGSRGAILGSAQGLVATNPVKIPEKPSLEWRRDNSCLVAGLYIEGNGHYLANGSNLYLFGCGGAGGAFTTKEAIEETNGGRVVILRSTIEHGR